MMSGRRMHRVLVDVVFAMRDLVRDWQFTMAIPCF